MPGFLFATTLCGLGFGTRVHGPAALYDGRRFFSKRRESGEEPDSLDHTKRLKIFLPYLV